MVIFHGRAFPLFKIAGADKGKVNCEFPEFIVLIIKGYEYHFNTLLLPVRIKTGELGEFGLASRAPAGTKNHQGEPAPDIRKSGNAGIRGRMRGDVAG